MQKKCQQCAASFDVTDEDLKFYEKVSPIIDGKKQLIPSPTLCPDDRSRRRLAFRNERVLYKRKSNLSGKEIISFFHQGSPYTVYAHDEWWSDNWDPLQYGQNFDFSKPFFDQFQQLQLKVPRSPLVNNKSENSDYCNFADNNKNCYLLTSANYNQNCYYGFCLVRDSMSADMFWCVDCQKVYECIDCQNCYNVAFAQNCESCSDSMFLFNCRNVKNSLACVNLRGNEYHILNQPVSKEEFERRKKEIAGSFSQFQKLKNDFENLKLKENIRKAENNSNVENVYGNHIFNSKNIYLSFDIYDCVDLAYARDAFQSRDCFDVSFFDNAELSYESMSLIGYHCNFSMFCRGSFDLLYCDDCHSSKDCFGCIGLRKKQYCILNKQYSKEEYSKLVPQIIEHMKKTGEWGEFFPVSISPFAYNETLANESDPMTKEQVEKMNWKWFETEQIKESSDQQISLPDNIFETDGEKLKAILNCSECHKKYRLIPQEINLYKDMALPVPRNCPACRHQKRYKMRLPRKIWQRKCANCQASIQTTYAPDRPERVYCEGCYLKEIY